MRKIATTILCYGIAIILLFFGMSFNEADALFCILLVANLLGNNSNSDRAIYVTESPDICHQVAVLNYIHDLDGKKRV